MTSVTRNMRRRLLRISTRIWNVRKGKPMLEFQEGFFDQEVREGFYIDPTMKTVWAAELELLQKVAEICDRHGIVWFAAYGTLLGAIRHEGFVPWDDDLDIWVKRKDYNELLRVLPLELPEGYEVKSPLTQAGYDQFHMMVNNGSFSMEERRRREYHGCPFSVGLDIFPLDCLPRDAAAREMQQNLVMLATRGAQLASWIHRGEYDRGEDPAEQKKAFREEIWEGIHYLESCGAKIDPQLAEREEWYRVASEFGRWANCFAMMYSEEESDYLVNYVDYVRWPNKKFSREYFSEIYSASFENFMLPVPCGYEQVLRRIYGAYEVLRKRTGTHEYPGYVLQLRRLKNKLENESAFSKMLEGIVPAYHILLNEDTSLLPEWKAQLEKANEKNRKIIFFSYECYDMKTQGEQALNRLESVLDRLSKMRKRIVVWWRPQKNMESRLTDVSQELAHRYHVILEKYKEEGWGICDETDRAGRAAAWCDAYYGNMSGAVQLFQRAGKTIMLMNPDI